MSGIRFPQIHIAESVSNRILNVADGLPSPSVALPAPVMPDIATQSDELDAQVITPPVPTPLPEGSDGAVVDAALNGESLVSPAVQPLLGV